MTASPRIKAVNFDDAVQRIQIAVPVQGVFDTPIPIKTLRIPFVSAAGIRCNRLGPFQINECIKLLPFDESHRFGGKLDVDSTSSIFIGKEGGINGSNCGLRRGSKYENRCYLKYGQFIGNTEEQNGSEFDNGAGGGIIVISAAGFIENNGVLLCEPSVNGVFSGGMICIVANRKFVNNGRMSCGESGVIDIRCNKFVNEGVIDPIPTIHIIESRQTTKVKVERFELHVLDHRGHLNEDDGRDMFHPRQLLVGGDRDTHYTGSQSKGPPNEDWIIFGTDSVDSKSNCIRRIGIRNWWDRYAIKRILIEGSADNRDYEKWIELGEIKKGQDEVQFFYVDMASSLYAMENKWRFYRLCFLENYGAKANVCCEFLIFGTPL